MARFQCRFSPLLDRENVGVFGVIVVSVTQPVGGSRLMNLPNFDLNLEYSGKLEVLGGLL